LKGHSQRHITSDDLKKVNYLRCVIKESLRLLPPVPITSRIISEDIKIGDYELLKGNTVLIFIYMIHRDERYFPEPEKFNPDRFSTVYRDNDENKSKHYSDPLFYIPFSWGRRNCIGQRFAQQEMLIILINLIRKFELKSLKTIGELKPSFDLILKPLNGIPMQITPRTN
jgi:cytochrome P450